MPIIKCDNETVQVEFGTGDVIPLTLGLPQENGVVIPSIVILPMHEAMILNKEEGQDKKFTDFDVRMIFTNLNQIDFMAMQVAEARRIMLLSEDENEESAIEEAVIAEDGE